MWTLFFWKHKNILINNKLIHGLNKIRKLLLCLYNDEIFFENIKKHGRNKETGENWTHVKFLWTTFEILYLSQFPKLNCKCLNVFVK